MIRIFCIKKFALFLGLVIFSFLDANSNTTVSQKIEIGERGAGYNYDCPIIATTDYKNISICVGSNVTFNIVTNASKLPFEEIELYSFETAQSNPYVSTEEERSLMGKFNNDTGVLSAFLEFKACHKRFLFLLVAQTI